jgi:hypothetical protein
MLAIEQPHQCILGKDGFHGLWWEEICGRAPYQDQMSGSTTNRTATAVQSLGRNAQRAAALVIDYWLGGFGFHPINSK